MQHYDPRQLAGPKEQVFRPQNSILKKSGTWAQKMDGTGAAQEYGRIGVSTTNGSEVGNINGAPAIRQFVPGQLAPSSPSPVYGNQGKGFHGITNYSTGQREDLAHANEGTSVPQLGGGNMDGPSFTSCDPSLPQGLSQHQESLQGRGLPGSVYGMEGGNPGSFFGSSRNIMGPGMGGEVYDAGFGNMVPGMGGEGYDAGFGNMYENPIITAQWASLNSVDPDSMYGGGCVQRSSLGFNINQLCPNISTTEGHVKLNRSGKRGGKRTETEVMNEKGEMVSTGTAVAPLLLRKSSLSKNEESRVTAKCPANYNIHTLILVDKDSDLSKRLCISVKDPITLLFKRENGEDEKFENDECILRDNISDNVNSVLLVDLQDHWIAGHTSALLVGGAKDRGEESVQFARRFLTQCLEKVEKNSKEKLIEFDITVTFGLVESTDRIRDLLNPENATYEKMQLGSSPVFGPCLCGMKSRNVKSLKECVDVFDEAIGRSDEKKQLVVGFFVLKQLKKSSEENDVYLSSLCMGLAREEISHFNELREMGTSDLCTLFRYAIGGASVTVTTLLLSERDPNSRGCLELGRKMREIKNNPPRIGNLRRCLEKTKKEIGRQRENMDQMSDAEKKLTERIVARMETIVKDSEEMLSNPDSTNLKFYSMGG
ncbi:hypothetical protein C3747_94g142 [Trypanosoma cruzi]|uniref:Uncharacterized protein n=2 Tax=Trypanosoma cruzi TaxID=5693 RepID=Q4DD68_TRYCC|nr:hypothetical protein, conserved [Trypanosoma cruzi]EAN90469.1 hypothetical protein, conserved [Trypanosoma cruzi]PWV08100.1 hypothetical protein C3747_94g142 [Trypanosoma cruzi]|eukprot:XP_812320.1 hypothetical protein [Trypanosoma cruzi strain CL Brener]